MSSVNPLLLLPLLLLFQPIFAVAQSYSNVSLGSSLTADGDDTSWRSPSGDFAFGFRPLENNLFLLAIWFDKIPDKTIVWYADGIETAAPKGSKVELTNDGKLVLNDPQGKKLWEAGPVNGGVSYAAMLDNGNFILVSRDSSINSWESFKQPTDTILPTQTMEVNSVLYSRQTENTFSRGRFRLRLLQDGNLVLNIAAFPSLTEVQYDAYYWSHTFDPNQTIAGYRVVFNESGYIYVVRRNGDIVFLRGQNIVPSNDVYYRATLDYDGVFTQYSYPRTSSGKPSWSIVWSAPDNICRSIGGVLGSGACGYNSYCILTPERRPTCQCPPGYSFVDPNNSFSGCKPNFIQGCQGEEWRNPGDKFEFQTLQDIDWPTSDYEKLDLYREKECTSACLSDCLCAVAIIRAGTCWKKKLPLSNGRYSSSMNGKALIKVRKDGFSIQQNSCPPISGPKKDRSTLILVGSLLLGSSVFFNLLLLAPTCLMFFFKDYKKMRKINQESSVLISNLRAFTYKELEEATGGFKEELGKGAFGIVYKGVIQEMGSKNYIAVKKLDKVVQEGEKEFKTEVSVIGRTHHKNLVQLLGFCEEGQHRLLVYEFMSNSNLAKHLFEISKPDWNQRIQIATCIARGLMYLHEECNTQIIHCDIKPQNILLDDNFTARISDFGLAKLLMNEQTRTRTGIRGTKGYVAPEWFRNTPVTVKVDVYSFGVMLLEIICCRKSVELELGEEEKTILTDWAYDCYREGKLQDLVENDGDAMNDMRRLERLVMIAIWCIQEEPSLRPSMKKVLQMLEGVLDVYVPPCPYPSNTVYDHSQSL